MATPSEIAAKKRQEAERKIQAAAAQAKVTSAQTKLATYGNQAEINFAKNISPKFTAMQDIAGRILAKAPNRPEVLKNAGVTLDQLQQTFNKTQASSTEYATKVTGITQAEQDLATAQGQIGQYSAPVYIPEEDVLTSTNLSEEAFINTLKLLMGSAEASKPYVKQLYTLVSKYYKTGSTIPESINLALYDAQENKLIPEFTTRFSGIFKLRDRRAAGEVIDVPTIAEYIKSQEGIAEVLRNTGLKDLANETFLNTVMATGKSVDESTSIIVDVFDLIDNAPEVVKAQFAKNYPSVSRAQLATALLTGTEGVKQLEKTVKKSGVIAAGTMQGIQVSDTLASDLVSKGQNFQTAGVGFSKVAQILPEARRLKSIDAGLAAGQQTYTTEQAVAATFDQSAKELQTLADMAEREGARFSKRTGIAGSRSLASQARGYGSGLI